MKTSQFDYNLPPELIANRPVKTRGSTNLMVLDRATATIRHKNYSDIPDYIKKGDLVVLNKTKVIKARLYGVIERNGKNVECLFLKPRQEHQAWEVLIGYSRYVRVGDLIKIFKTKNQSATLKVIGREIDNPAFLVQMIEIQDRKLFEEYGSLPLPAYIKRKPTKEDETRYNTVFAQYEGSVAAPTASINLTKEIIKKIENNGAKIIYVDLTVGWGTFAPVRSENIEDHNIHSEHYSISKESCDAINFAIDNNCRIWSFGTTATRVLETVAYQEENGKYYARPSKGETSIYIYPGYQFKLVDILVTNFHAPKTSLIMLVSAFAGYQFTMKAYNDAVENRYNFLSYGDSMLIM